MQKIGVIGCGLMGTGIVQTLLKNAYDVIVYDINESAVEYLVTYGAKKASHIRELADHAEVVILSLPSASLIEQTVLTNADSLLKVMKKNTTIIDMSTNDVTITKNLSVSAKKHQIYFFDCPLSGGPEGAHHGTLTMMIGGNQEKLSEIQPILQVLGKHIHYMGPAGSGQIVKLCNNMLVAGIIALLSEVLQIGEDAGLSKEKVAEILQQGSGQTKVMDVFGPNILAETYENIIFSLPNMVKDLSLYESLAKQSSDLSISEPIISLFKNVLQTDDGQLDVTIVDQYI